MAFIRKRSIILIITISAVLSILIAIWIGGSERWQLEGINFQAKNSEEIIAELKKQQQASSNPLIIKYNLGYTFYQNSQLEEAKKTYHEIINSGQGGIKLQKASFYNLGNTMFRLAEKAKDISQALQLYQESLKAYRGGIEKEKQEQQFLDQNIKRDPDLHSNYALTQKRIKILSDKLRQQEKESASQKELYALLKEIKDEETAVLSRLADLDKITESKKHQKIKEELLNQHQNSMKKLRLIKEKMIKLFSQTKQPPPPASQNSGAKPI